MRENPRKGLCFLTRESLLANSNFGKASVRPYRCQLSDLLPHVTPRVKALLNNVSLMRNTHSHEAAGPGQKESVFSQRL